MALPPTISGDITPAGCFNQNYGRVVTSVTPGVPPYTYQWSDGSTGQNLEDVRAGAYWVRVTDADGNTGTNSFVIPASNLQLDFTFQQPKNISTVLIKAIPFGGVAPYTYLWDTGDTTQEISANIAAHACTVTDTLGCEITESVLIIEKIQQELDKLICCSGAIGKKYVCQRKGGEFDEAKKTISNLKLLNGYIRDLCSHYQNSALSGLCLTDEEFTSVLLKSKKLCACCLPEQDSISPIQTFGD